jgi:hypothetical protein
MRALALTLALALAPGSALAIGPTATFTLPAADTTPSPFGTLPWPVDLYFDQGQPGDGDGTLLNAGASMGLDPIVYDENAESVEDGLDVSDGFGTTSAIFFFFSGPLDPASLPASPVTSPALTDSVFCVDTATLTPVPIALKPDADTRLPNTLSVLPLPGRPLAAQTRYACVVRTAVTGGGDPVEPSADWVSVRDGASANADADAIFDPVVAALGVAGVPAADIAGMTIFTTTPTSLDVRNIRATVLPSLPVPTADFASRPELIFDSQAELDALLGPTPHDNIAIVATGYFDIPMFQTPDPTGEAQFQDFPIPPSFVNCLAGNPCETNDERFERMAGIPIVNRTKFIPFTVVIPKGTPPPGGWPVVIQQHGLGGQRDTVVQFGDADAARGFASIGIDAVAHGYRLFNCQPTASCVQDNFNNFGGTTVPDGFVDGTVLGFDVSFIAVNVGFFQAFHNFVGIRDNFRQTYVDLSSLVRLLQGNSIDVALGANLDDTRIFYVGHSLGGLMGAGFVPIEPDVSASLLNATGGGLSNQLFINSSIGAGAQALVNGILGLDPMNVSDQFAIPLNIIQGILDPADAVNSADLYAAPALGSPRNVIQVEDYGDQVVPNQSNEALAVAAGFPLFQPYVENLHQSPFSLSPVPTPDTVSGNVGGATQALLQNGPATHAASVTTVPGTLTFVPEFAHEDDFLATGNGFPTLERGIRVPNAGILDEVLDWFEDVVINGPPGTFAFNDPPNFNPVQNLTAIPGSYHQTFFARTVNAGGAAPFSEPTPDVDVDFTTNVVETRVTAGRTTLGSTPLATDADMPPGPAIAIGTPGVLPFFVILQRNVPGLFTASVDVRYTPLELALAGIPDGSADEAALVLATFTPGACTMGGAPCSEDADCGANGPCAGTGYTVLPGGANAALDLVTATGLTSFSTFAVVHPDALAGGYVPPPVPGGGPRVTDCTSEVAVLNPTNAPFLDQRGLVNKNQVCTDGDLACDADRTADGVCTFRVAICFNQSDASLPTCTPTDVAQYRLNAPKPVGANVENVTNGQALAAALVALGATQGGSKQHEFTFGVPLAAPTCSAFTDFVVPLRPSGVGRKAIRGRIQTSGGTVDRDSVRLRCLAATP